MPITVPDEWTSGEIVLPEKASDDPMVAALMLQLNLQSGCMVNIEPRDGRLIVSQGVGYDKHAFRTRLEQFCDGLPVRFT